MNPFQRLKRRVAPGPSSTSTTPAPQGAARVDRPAGQRPVRPLLTPVARELLRLALPIAAAMLGETALGLVDTKLVGGLGALALGGVGIATTLMYLSYGATFGMMRGVKVRTAYAVGRGTPEDGVRYALAGMAMGAFAGACVFVLGRDVSWALSAIGIEPSLIPYAKDFLSAVTYGAPATCALCALVNHRQGLGDSRTPMLVGIGGNLVNAVLSYGLIYGRFGLPALGVRGGGFGTATTEWLELSAMTALLVRDTLRARGSHAVTLSRAAREVADLGVPTGLQFTAEMLAFTTFTAVLGTIGGAQIAAHQIALATIRTSFLPGVAIGEAACVMIGQELAKGHLRQADRVTRTALAVAVAFMATCGVVFGVFGGWLAHAFTPDAEVAMVAKHLLWVAAGFQVLDAVNVVLRGCLRGAKDVRVAAILGIAIVWSCVPTAAFFLGKVAGWGALGGWCGFVLETSLASVLFWRRWTKGAWRNDAPRRMPADAHRERELAAA